MFPDAPSARASRHLKELAVISRGNDNMEGHVVFVIMNPGTRQFIPNLHTDPEFARTVSETAPHVHFHGVSTICDAAGELDLVSTGIPVRTDLTSAADNNSGIYLLLITMDRKSLAVGSLGEIDFKKGYYIYVGSAATNLKSRVDRHLRKRKKYHWHADRLLGEAIKVKAFPIYTVKNLECSLAGDMKKDRGR